MAGTQRSLLKKIRRRQLEFLGHIVRKENLEHLIVTGKIEGKRSKGRQRQTYIDSLSKWIGMSTQELLENGKRKMVVELHGRQSSERTRHSKKGMYNCTEAISSLF